MNQNPNKITKEYIASILIDIERYDEAIQRNLNASIQDSLIIRQFQDLRNDLINQLLDYLVQQGNKELLKQYVKNMDIEVSTAA